MTHDIMRLADVPIGSTIECEGGSWVVDDIRRHAMTRYDNTAWLILKGWKAAGMGDPPKPALNACVRVETSFS